MDYFYKLILQYKGTRYLGWQIQTDESRPTIQGELNQALRIISKSEDVKTIGSGRTDAGVHSLHQVVKIKINLNIPPEKLMRALNVNLPDDIRVVDAAVSNESFRPTLDARSKEYHYRFTNQKSATALQSDFIYNYPFPLDIQKMQEACKILIGKHDFSNFYCVGTDVSHNVREIFECEILHVDQGSWMLPSHYVFRIVGNGFLKQMVRLLMGALWNIGRGKITLEEFNSALSAVRVQRLGPVAPPNGLYLVRVNY